MTTCSLLPPNPKRHRISIVLHNPNGSMGLIKNILESSGYTLDIYCPLAGDVLPAAELVQAAIVFGGKMSANDTQILPALADEMNWIKELVSQSTPFLGICLGAQLLAKAHGGEVTRYEGSIHEIGYHHVYPTIEGFQDVFSAPPERFFQWHNEVFSIPDGAIKLAAGDLCPNQAFKLGKSAYGFQFHPEATPEQIQHWHERDSEELTYPGAQRPQSQWRFCEQLTPSIERWLIDFLTHWLQL